jgi:hypothetical protein
VFFYYDPGAYYDPGSYHDPAPLSRTLLRAVARRWAALRGRADAGPSDVAVTILHVNLAPLAQGGPSVITLIANPGPVPVLAGLAVRRRRRLAWRGNGPRATVTRMTTRRRYRAVRQPAVCVVPADGMRALPVPFTAIRGRYRVVAVVGQSDRRLRVISLPFVIPAETDEPETVFSGPFPWLT